MNKQCDGKKINYFWHLLILRRLEKFASQHSEELKQKGVNDLVDMLCFLDSPHLVPLITTGKYGLKNRERLGDLFDDFKMARFDLQRDLDKKTARIEWLQEAPYPVVKHRAFIERSHEIAQLKEEAQDLAIALAKVPERNTIPDSLWAYPDQHKLKKEGFIVRVVERNEYPQLTDRGFELFKLSTQLMGTLPVDLNDPEIAKEHARAIWEQVKLAMKRKGKFRSIIGKLFNDG